MRPSGSTGRGAGVDEAATLQRAHGLVQQGRYRGAAREVTGLLKRRLRPTIEQPARRLLGVCLMREGLYARAAEAFARSLELSPTDADLACELARALQYAGDAEGAEEAARALLRRRPDHAEGVARLASALQALGRHEEAVGALDDAAERGLDHPALVIAMAGSARRVGREEEVVARLAEISERADVTPAQRQEAAFQLAALLDKLARFDEAMDRLEAAHAMVPVSFDPRGLARETAEMIRVWTPEAITSARGRDLSQTPVFIVGMPRSGTTLVENILGAHSRVHPAGELMSVSGIAREMLQGTPGSFGRTVRGINERQVAANAQAYLGELRGMAPDAARVVDKQPFNFLHLGLIAKLWPGARVIHTVRDPRDTCLSCHFRQFAGSAPWASRQRWLGAFYVEYARLMEHWSRVLPETPVGLRMMQVRYEDLIDHQERVSRALIEFVGLDWEDRVLRFHEKPRHAPTLNADEVGRPVYASSVGRWRAYEHRIGDLLAVLGPVLEGDRGAGST
ncbi:MAG: tetratricopeptide repeat-containing sulfotransferase family protein [Phycisphaerales bacterium JB059]